MYQYNDFDSAFLAERNRQFRTQVERRIDGSLFRCRYQRQSQEQGPAYHNDRGDHVKPAADQVENKLGVHRLCFLRLVMCRISLLGCDFV